MRLCRFEHKEQAYWGELIGDEVRAFSDTSRFPSSKQSPDGPTFRLAEVRFLTPVTPSKIVCIGRNYAAHAAELGNELPESPLIFLKAPTALVGDGEAIVVPGVSARVEHEAELGVIISRTCRRLSNADDPFEYIFGFVCVNDVTARDIQKKEIQFTRAKSFDTFCPVGRIVETELDIRDLSVQAFVNGELKQDGRTSQMVFPVGFLIRYISNQMTLLPGDLIATGTPAGVSQLVPGDVCEIRIEGLGSLRNPVTN